MLTNNFQPPSTPQQLSRKKRLNHTNAFFLLSPPYLSHLSLIHI